jgi:SagB-type dehydrogenase family enzyme
MLNAEAEEYRRQLVGSRDLFSISELYHENSRIIAEARGIAQSAESIMVASVGFKRYVHSLRTALPAESVDRKSAIFSAIVKRRSCRTYTGAAIPLEALSDLIFYSLGQSVDGEGRFRPSAGGLYPLELYLMCFNVLGLEPALYHYDVRSHGLSQLERRDFRSELSKAIFVEGAVHNAAAAIVITGVFGRSKIKYGERAYRFVLLEAGHAMQNICLASTVLDLGTCPVGGFVDDQINDLLNVDGVEEAALYAATIGIPT